MATLFDGIGANGFSSGFSAGNAVREMKEKQARQKGLASGFTKVLNGDNTGWQEMANADPVATMNAWNTQQALNQKNLEKQFNTTNEIKNYEYAKKLGLSEEDAQKYGFIKTNNDPVSLYLEKEQAKQDMAAKKEKDSALREYEQLSNTYNRLFDNGGLMEKAELGYGLEDSPAMRLMGYATRQTPTQLFNNDVQTARQEIMNILGQLRLDQMQYLKGAISDKEQQMLADFVSGDISKYSPAQIKGTFNSLMNKIQAKYGKTEVGQKQTPSREEIIEELKRRGEM